jgi:hypothetical protein
MTEKNPDDIWEYFLGKDPRTPALPDYYSNYFDYSFDRTQGDARYIGLRITGEFGYARYMSYNVYDAEEGASFGALTDFQINPLPGNINPFLAGSDDKAKNRSYTVTVLPESYSSRRAENQLTYDGSAVNVLAVIIRYYVPQDSVTAHVPLPTIEAFDLRTQQSVTLPQPYRLRGSMPKAVLSLRLAPVFKTVVDDTLRFYRASGAGQFENADNIYLINAVEQGEDAVLLIRIKPPSYPANNDQFGETDVRYWSFNEGDADTSTPFGMKDEQFKAAKDGFVYIAIGNESICSKAEERGYNFMPWKAERTKAVILYRNMLTNRRYAGNLMRVPIIEPKDLLNKQNLYDMDAKNYIGDYAPTGKKVSQALFMLGKHEIVSPGF